MVAAARARTSGEPTRSRPRMSTAIVGARMRERRIMLGLTQQQMAELIGVTYQQAHKYEKGINRIAGGRLYQIAKALGVEVSYFYDGVGGRSDDFKPTPQQRLLLELARNFIRLAQPPPSGGDLQPGPGAGRSDGRRRGRAELELIETITGPDAA